MKRGAWAQAFPKHTPYSYLRPTFAWIIQLCTMCTHLEASSSSLDLLQNSFKTYPIDLRYLEIIKSLDLFS